MSRLAIQKSSSGHRLGLLLAVLGVALAILSTSLSARAASPPQNAAPTPTPLPPRASPGLLSIGNDTCLECHGRPGLSMPLKNGEILDLYASPDEYEASIHGSLGYACVQCHTQVGEYPHPAYSAASLRQVTLELNNACQRCHAAQYQLTQDSVHARALAEGKQEAAVCTDCHSAHATRRLKDPQTQQLLPEARLWVPQTCAKCHGEIYEKYLTSVHGNALVDENNRDVPTCIDCHGVHNIEDPTTGAFRLKSPSICANCHTNPDIMDKYGISTNVLNTYVSDFHGTTVVLFEKQSPDAETNKPVCYDCHGIHDIPSVDDPVHGLHVQENLLVRCQVCHPGASANFPTAWLSHYIPSPEKYPLVYYVNLFYKIFIPTLLGGMALLVILDFSKTARTTRLPHRLLAWLRASSAQTLAAVEKVRPKRVPEDSEASASASGAQPPDESSAPPEEASPSDEEAPHV